MQINERYISDVQNYEEGLQAIEELCVCGHPLKAHAYVTLPYPYFHKFPDNVYPSQCVACGISQNKFVCSHWRSLTTLALDLACAECGEVFEAHKYNNCGHEFRNPPSQ